MERLPELANIHRKLPFPEFPEDDDFADWVSDLVEVDGYYVGFAMSLINGEKPHVISAEELQALTDSFEKFSEIEGEDASIYLDCKKYLFSLKALVDEMAR